MGMCPFDAPDEQREQGQALRLGQPSGDAEVEQRDLPRRQHEEVPAVQVAVEDPVDHGALEEADHAGPHDRLGVDAGGAHALDVAEVEPVEALHHQHPAGDQRRVRAGHDEVALVQRGERHGDIEHVLGLETEVELLDDRLGEELDQGRRVGQRGDRDAADEVRRQPRHDGEVLAHPRRDRRALHLHHDRRPVAQRGGVHLGDGGRGQRGVLDGGEHRLERPAQLLGEHPLDDRPRLGRDLVAAPLELGDQLGREDAVARGDDLAQLDVGRAEPLGRHPQPARDAGDRRRAAAPALLQVPQPERAAEVPHRRAQPAAGGSVRRRVRRGSEASRRARTPASPLRQASVAGSTVHGPVSVNVPSTVSGFATEFEPTGRTSAFVVRADRTDAQRSGGRTSPDWKAKTTACTRSRSPSLASRRPTCDLTVASET